VYEEKEKEDTSIEKRGTFMCAQKSVVTSKFTRNRYTFKSDMAIAMISDTIYKPKQTEKRTDEQMI